MSSERILRSGRVCFLKSLIIFILLSRCVLFAADAPRSFPLALKSDDVIPTGNEWIALPTIRAADGALESFNALSMRNRGLLEVTGERGTPAIQPYFMVDGKALMFRNLSWEVIEYWIPRAHWSGDGVEATITYCAPPEARAAFLHLVLTNRRGEAITAKLGLRASFGALSRVTYLPVELRGERTISESPWVPSSDVFSFITHDTDFAWAIDHPKSTSHWVVPPQSIAPRLEAERQVTLAPGEKAEADFVIGVGIEEFSAPHSSKALRELIDREGADAVINEAAAWYRARTRTTGQPDLDLLMNRNFLFTAFYAWGRTIDTEQFVGVTSRSPRYYVSAAYWDRDAMLWSFPGLLDADPNLAKEALEYALTIQLRNTGIHSRFIDGVVLEDGFQLDEAVAPVIAMASYVRRTNDDAFLAAHVNQLKLLRDRILARFDPQVGLYSTLQDSQDEYQKQAFLTYDNVLAWKALLDLGEMYERLKDVANARDMKNRAVALRTAILTKSVSNKAPGATGTMFVGGTDGTNPLWTDVPPGSLMRLPELGFISEDDPLFVRTYEWFHSANYKYSFGNEPFGLPGSYRLPITTSWSVADHMHLKRGRDQAMKVLRASTWDGGIITEGVNPKTATMDYAGRAFATAAGYVAHAICESFCKAPGR